MYIEYNYFFCKGSRKRIAKSIASFAGTNNNLIVFKKCKKSCFKMCFCESLLVLFIFNLQLLFCFFYFQPKISHLGLPQGPSGEKVAVVAVDDCDIAMAVRFGNHIGNYSCAAQGTQTGQKK